MNDIKIKNFTCSIHGKVKPIVTAICPECSHTSTEEEILREEILKEIDFLCDHWVEGDDKSPYRFGWWREEVGDTLVKIYTTKLQESIAQERESLRDKILNNWTADLCTNSQEFRNFVLSHLTQ